MSAPELKPCPFCGSDNVKSGGDDKIVGVWCLNCQATGPNGYLTTDGEHDWNTRADLHTAVVAERDELRNERDALRAALDVLCKLNDDSGPFGGEMFYDRVSRAWDQANVALAGSAP